MTTKKKSTKEEKSRTPRKRGPSKAARPYDNDLEYLQDELAWIEARARRVGAQIRMKLLEAGEELPSRGWNKRKDDESPWALQKSRESFQGRERRLRKKIDQRLAAHRAAGGDLAVDRLCQSCGLDDFERTVLLLATAPCISRKYESIFEALDRDGMQTSLNVEVAFTFLETPLAERVERRRTFSPRGALMQRDLVTVDVFNRYNNPKDLLVAEIDLTARTFNYLLGDLDISDDFLEFSSVEEPLATLDQVVMEPADKQRILSVVERHDQYLACRKQWGFDDVIAYGRGVLMLFYGKPGTGKTMTAHAVAHAMGKRVLNVDIPTFAENREAERFLPGLFREARLQDAVLFFDECEVIFSSRRQGNALMTLLLTEIERFDGVAILATNLPQALDEALDRRILVKVRFPEPDRQARLEIWRRHLPAAAPLAVDVDLDLLADRYEMAGGYIKNAILVAVADAVHGNGKKPTITMAHLERAARDQLRKPRDEESDLVQPTACLDDVILPPELLAKVEELIGAARNRRTVLERWGIGAHLSYGKGVSALLYGEPGTGKTLCAEAVASELHRPLLTATVPGLVSKWVGETEMNLDALFREARTQGAVLFLDEADSLLMERGAGHASRHDDSAVNVLLKLVERHDGVVLLATNLPERLDRALSRRLTYRLCFPLPGAGARTAIWRRLLPGSVPAENLDLTRLGQLFALSGGQIKNAVFKAAYRAAAAGGGLSQPLLEGAANEEMEDYRRGNGKAIGFGAVDVA